MIKMKKNFRLLMEIILLLAGIILYIILYIIVYNIVAARLEKRRVPLGRPGHHGKQC